MKERYKVVSKSPVWVKKEPSWSAKNIALAQPNDHIDVVLKENGFLRYTAGWIPEYTTDKTNRLVERVSMYDNGGIATFSAEEPENSPVARAATTEITGTTIYDEVQTVNDRSRYTFSNNADQYASSYTHALSSLDISTLRGIHGMPYQWIAESDPRLNGKTLGRVYAERIIARMPLFIIAAGEPEFLAGYSTEQKENVLEQAVESIENGISTVTGGQSELDRFLTHEGKYYSFKYAGNSYYFYLNPMLRTAAELLNIGDVQLDGTALRSYDWRKTQNPAMYQYWTGRKSIAFYIDSETQVSDSFSNDDTTSALASKVNGFSDMAKEIGFLLGGASAATGLKVDALFGHNMLTQENIGDSASSWVSENEGMNNFLRQITGGFQTVLAGGKLIFPNIWSDSSFNRSYNVNFKFVSPDYDDLSWYMNILVPVCHLLTLTFPRQSGPNGYLSPFLVRAFYKGLFNCDMGLITSLDIQKGTDGGWTKSGLPTVVNVSMTIKDLYSNISMTETKNMERNILTNSIFMDYLANLCGVNINEPDITRMVRLYYSQLFGNRITDIPANLMGAIDTTIMNYITQAFNRFTGR